MGLRAYEFGKRERKWWFRIQVEEVLFAVSGS